MKIAVIGGGAVGLLIASYLSESEHLVHVITKTEKQAQKINLDGIIRINKEQTTTFFVQTYALTRLLEKQLQSYDVIFVAVKQYHIDDIMPYLAKITNYCVFLQNGLGHEEKINKLANPCIGIVEHGVQKLTLNSIEHTGMGKIIIGTMNDLELETLLKLSTINFPIQYSKHIKQIQITKLIINAVINPLTAFYGVRNGQLMKEQNLKEQAERLCLEVCQTLGIIAVPKQKEMWHKVREICQLTANNYSSMYCDFKNKRPSELANILGYIVKLQTEDQFVNETTTLAYRLYQDLQTKALEEKRQL